MVGIDDIRSAAAWLDGRVHRTPVLGSRTLGRTFHGSLLLKPECLQRTGSFKVRGALNRVHHLTADERARGLVAVSAGNHAQAVAYAAGLEGIRATVVMPEHAVATKVEASRGYGADVVLHGDVFAAFAKMEELREEHGYTLVHPFEDPHVMAGQGTVGLELCDDVADLDLLLVPIGGGGLISGVAAAVRALQPRCRIIGVEPIGSAAMSRALEAGAPVRLEASRTIADGLGAPMTAPLALEHVQRLVDDVVTVSDDAIAHALRMVLERCKLLVEPAGAAGVAALLDGTVTAAPGARVATILSGGNIDSAQLRNLLDTEDP